MSDTIDPPDDDLGPLLAEMAVREDPMIDVGAHLRSALGRSRPTDTVMVVDDDEDLRGALRFILEDAGFAVIEAADGRQALRRIQANPPTLILLDFKMPGLTGPQVCAQLKRDVVLRHIPIIMLTAMDQLADRVFGIDAGADDYLLKPVEAAELVARVKMAMRRAARDLDANPLTRLPGNHSIHSELEQRLAARESLAVCYIDLNRFKAFNDHYGFKRGDDVILATAAVLLEASRTAGSPTDFVGHIGGDDFLVATTVEHARPLCEAIVRIFDAQAPLWYDEVDRTRGYLLHTDRQGREIRVPLLSIAVALVFPAAQDLDHPGQIAKVGAELKAYAKRLEGSVYVTERRQPVP